MIMVNKKQVQNCRAVANTNAIPACMTKSYFHDSGQFKLVDDFLFWSILNLPQVSVQGYVAEVGNLCFKLRRLEQLGLNVGTKLLLNWIVIQNRSKILSSNLLQENYKKWWIVLENGLKRLEKVNFIHKLVDLMKFSIYFVHF